MFAYIASFNNNNIYAKKKSRLKCETYTICCQVIPERKPLETYTNCIVVIEK